MSQMSLFSAGVREPQPADLEGLLAGPGQVVRRGTPPPGGSARVSVVVADGWRVGALTAEMAALGLDAELEPAEPGSVTVRSPWLAALKPVADAWTRGAIKIPPPGWVLDGARLRWWCLAAGTWTSAPGESGMYTLSLGASDEPAWGAVGAALAAAGVPGVLVGPRADGPAYRIVGQRRLARLRELVGSPPAEVPTEAWPGDVRAHS
jgi:hypothetical protein